MIKRREFLASASAAIFLGGLGSRTPAILGADDKAGSEKPIVGEGEFQFECDHDWCRLPRHLQWQTTQGVAVSTDGLVYVIHQGSEKSASDTIAVFDLDGRFVRSFGKEFSGGGHGIEIRREGNGEFLYVCDTLNRQVVKLDTFGEWVWKKRYPRGSKHYESVEQFQATNVCFGSNGDLFVADGYGSDFIHHYDSDGVLVRSLGGNGKLAGQFQTPHGLLFDDRGGQESIVVADRENGRLQFLAVDGTPRLVLQGVDDNNLDGETATIPDADGKPIPVLNRYGINRPASLDSFEGLLLVADMQSRLLILDEFNLIVARLGDDRDWSDQVMKNPEIRRQPDQWSAGKFIHPHDACFDQDGNIYVTEWVEPGRVTKLTWI